MQKIWENRPESLRVGEPEEITRYVPSLRGGGWGKNCYRGCRDPNFFRTGWIIKRAALQTDGQGLWVCRLSPRATLTSKEVHWFPSENTVSKYYLVPERQQCFPSAQQMALGIEQQPYFSVGVLQQVSPFMHIEPSMHSIRSPITIQGKEKKRRLKKRTNTYMDPTQK